jgi:hypothetical protein
MRQNKYKAQHDLLVKQMQFFCLEPSFEAFTAICASKKLQAEQAHVFDIWKSAALMCNGPRWLSDGSITKEDMKSALVEYVKNDKNVMDAFNAHPTDSRLDRIWFLFFATGRYKYLEAGYLAMITPGISSALADIAMQMYKTIKSNYDEQIEKLRTSVGSGGLEGTSFKSTTDAIASIQKLDEEIAKREEILNRAKSLKPKQIRENANTSNTNHLDDEHIPPSVEDAAASLFDSIITKNATTKPKTRK